MTHLDQRPRWDCKSLQRCLLFQRKTCRGRQNKHVTSHTGFTLPHDVWTDWRAAATHSAKALLFVLFLGVVDGKNSEEESGPGDSGPDSEKLRGRWWVVCWGWALEGSLANESTRLPNRPWERCKYEGKTGWAECPLEGKVETRHNSTQ